MRTARRILVAIIILALLGVGAIALIITKPWDRVGADSFAVTRDSIDDRALCPDDRTASFANAKGPFLFSDAVSSRLKPEGDKPSDALKAQMLAHCGEVGTGYATNEALRSKKLSIDGETVDSVNPWMSEMSEKFEEQGATAFLTKNLWTQKVEVTEEYRMYAALINSVLLRFQKVVLSEDDYSIANWHVAGADRFAVSAKMVMIPLAVLNTEYQENRPAVWIKAVDKGGTCHFVVGFNLEDKRPLVGRCNDPKSPPSTGSNPGNGGGGGGGGRVPVCKPNSKDIIWVPKSKAHKYKKPDANGTCVKTGSNAGLNDGTNENNTVNNNDGSTDSRGIQNDPQADAEAAAKKAAEEEAARKKAAEEAAQAATNSGGGDEEHEETTKPLW